MKRACERLLLPTLLLCGAPELAAQAALRVSTAVAPETVTVGDRFRSVLQVVAPRGATVQFGEVATTDTLQPVDTVRIIPSRAGEPPTAAYTLTAWVAGLPLSSQVSVRVARADGTAATYLVPLRLPVVRSVLPADGTEIRPRPGRGLLPIFAAQPSWRWMLLLVAGLALAVGGWLLWRRRASPVVADPLDARGRALAALQRLAREQEQGAAVETLYPAATRILRAYLAARDAAWSADLTTAELLGRMSGPTPGAAARDRLSALLSHADQVKFARYQPPREEVAGFLAGAREWVARYPEQDASVPAREAA